MAAELSVPLDELTGCLPLPFTPPSETTPIEECNAHHAFFPASSSELKVFGGAALRVCRIQLMDATHHNIGPRSLHAYFKGVDKIPVNKDEIFKTVVLACANYIPEMAIDMSSGEPKTVSLSRSQREQLNEQNDSYSSKYFHYGFDEIRDFFVQYMLDKDIESLDPLLLEEFLEERNLHKKRELGQFILWKAAEITGDEADEYYKFAKALHPELPPVQSFLKYKVSGRLGFRERLTERIERVLLAKKMASVAIPAT